MFPPAPPQLVMNVSRSADRPKVPVSLPNLADRRLLSVRRPEAAIGGKLIRTDSEPQRSGSTGPATSHGDANGHRDYSGMPALITPLCPCVGLELTSGALVCPGRAPVASDKWAIRRRQDAGFIRRGVGGQSTNLPPLQRCIPRWQALGMAREAAQCWFRG